MEITLCRKKVSPYKYSIPGDGKSPLLVGAVVRVGGVEGRQDPQWLESEERMRHWGSSSMK